MKPLRSFGLTGLLAAVAWLSLAGAMAAIAAAPDLEEQVRQIAAELRCPVCQNLSVADSPSTLAQEMRGLIREQLQQGKTPEEIRAYFVSKYGEWVLLTPKPSGFNLFVYVVPFLAAAVGVAGVLLAIRRWVRRRRETTEEVAEVSAADRERLRQALEAEEEEAEEAGPAVAEGTGPLAELEAQRAALYAAIRELEFDHKAGMISQEDYEAMRHRYEAEAVALLRRLDALGVGAPPRMASGSGKTASPAAHPITAGGRAAKDVGEEVQKGTGAGREAAARASRRRLWTAAWAIGLVVFGVAAGAVLALSIRPRSEGGSITGGPLTGTTSEMPPMASASAAEPGKADQPPRPLDPVTLARMLKSAHAALEAGKVSEAAAAYRAVLAREPRSVEAIAGLGTILERSGEVDLALHVYDKALEIEPRSLRTLWNKGNLLFQRADYAGAIKAWQVFFEAAPPGPDRDHAEQRMADARARLASSGPVPPPAPKAPAGTAQAAPPQSGR